MRLGTILGPAHSRTRTAQLSQRANNPLRSLSLALVLAIAPFASASLQAQSPNPTTGAKSDKLVARDGPMRDSGEMRAPTDSMAPREATPMSPYLSTVSYTVPTGTVMIMALPDLTVARSTRNFVTGMAMLEYGLTSRWTVGLMVEGQKIAGLPATYGGMRVSTFVRLFPRDDVLHFTLYGEYEDLNAAALYKMEVAGFGGEDLEGPLDVARRTKVRTFEQRAIVYHDWRRTNLTFNFINETGLDVHGNNLGYAWGLFRHPEWMGTMGPMSTADAAPMPAPPVLSTQRFGYGVEMIGALGNWHQFSLRAANQQQYVGPVFAYAISTKWRLTVEPAIGLSAVSDPFVLRMGLGTSIARVMH